MKLLQSKLTMLIGIGIIVISNAFALVGVSYNRSGEPTSTIILTERELELPYSYGFSEENSGIALRLRHRVYDDSANYIGYNNSNDKPTWLDKNKLLELGFDVNDSPDKPETIRRYSKILPREVLLVLEYNGATYQKALKRAEENWQNANKLHQNEPDNSDHTKLEQRAKSGFLREQYSTSRLFVIDAGLYSDALRKKYSDYSRYLIVPGSMRPSIDDSKSGFEQLSAYIRNIIINRINVPYDYRQVLEPMVADSARNKREDQPRYKAKLVYGKRLEPWIENVELIESMGSDSNSQYVN